ncbi:MAG TPA: chemotaxis response regulator protein-glutamate methylesterase [Verrucomicrobiota bacterium]|nr:chemotaxis response regulator protein-glutamate methylesterase [Verrucomicrobiota bacterium]
MRIGIVNDMFMAVEALRRVIAGSRGNEVAWIARDGAQAVELCFKDKPDLVLMDLVMPRMDGVQATRAIMEKSPCPIVIVTASIDDHSSKVFEAMGAGALDAVNTPVLAQPGNLGGAIPLLAKIETIRKLIGPAGAVSKTGFATTLIPAPRPHDFKHDKLVVVGASAGGPAALAKLLMGIPHDFPAAIVVVQHVDPQFAPGLATWLAGHTTLKVRVAEKADRPAAGSVLVAGHDGHLIFAGPSELGYSPEPHDSIYRPSIDVFFRSAARHWSGTIVGVVLTGMGHDGAEGLKLLRNRGHHTIAQDEKSCAVYGMPRAAAELDAATEILTLDKIAPRLTNMLNARH